MKKAAIGIDIGGTKTLCLLVNEHYKVLASFKFKTSPSTGKSRFVRKLLKAVSGLRRQGKKLKFRLVGIGVACAGNVNCESLSIKTSPNLISLEGCALGRHLSREFKVPVYLDNDVKMAVHGEHALGAARRVDNVLGIFFGTGVGSAAIINGKIHRGTSGMGGQIGALLAQPVGGPKAALSHGIVDRIASKAAIAGEALVMAVKEWAPYLHRRVGSNLAKVTWGTLRRSIEHGDVRVEEMLRARLKVVGIATSNVVNFFSPDLVVLGGGLVSAFPKLVLEEFDAGLRKYLVPEVSKFLKLREAQLGKQAAAIGAAHLALNAPKSKKLLRRR